MRGRNGGSNGSGCSQVPTAIPFYGQSCQHSAPVGARIDPDAVGPLLDLGADRVTMDDHEAVLGFVRQEWLADPSKVELTLLVDLNSRPDSGMDKQVVAETAGIDERSQELSVPVGNGVTNCSHCRSVARRCDTARVRSVASQALRPAKAKPARQVPGFAGEEAQHYLLVIAEQEDRSDILMAIGPQSFDDLGRAWSAVDEVAKEDQQDFSRLIPVDLGMDVVEQAVEQIEAAVYVADDVGAAALGTARGAGWI